MAQLAIRGGPPAFSGEFPSWPVVGDSDRQALLKVLDDGRWGIGGPCQSEFEAVWARFVGSDYAVTTSSGTTVLECGLRAVGVGPGDEVIIPAYTFQATATAVLRVNAVPVFADIHPGTLCMDPASAEAAITPRTRALLPVHLGGCPADMAAFQDMAARHGLALVEDACQAHGAEWKGRRVGSLGSAGAFSFQSTKNLAAGEGGALTTSDPAAAAAASAIRNCGTVAPGLECEPVVGANYRMTEFQAALLLSQMRLLPDQMARRDASARVLDRGLAAIPGISPQAWGPDTTVHAHHLYIFRYASALFGSAPREVFIKALQAEGVPCHAGYYPLYQAPFLTRAVVNPSSAFPIFSDRRYDNLHLPVTEQVCQEAVWLTQNRLLGPMDQAEAIVAAITKIHQFQDELRGHPPIS